MTSTFQTVNAIGWGYFEKLGKQKVLQVQSSTEPPKKLALGERAVSADGLEYVNIQLQEGGAPIAIVYPTEGTPFVPSCEAIAKNAPHPNAARLFISFMFSRETQQYLVDSAGLRSFHPEVKDKARPRTGLADQAAAVRPGRAGGGDRGDQEEIFAVFWNLACSKASSVPRSRPAARASSPSPAAAGRRCC